MQMMLIRLFLGPLAGLGAGVTEAVLVVTPTETVKSVFNVTFTIVVSNLKDSISVTAGRNSFTIRTNQIPNIAV